MAPVWLVRSWTAPKGTMGYLLGAMLLLAAWSAMLFLLRLGMKWSEEPMLLLVMATIVTFVIAALLLPVLNMSANR